MSRVRQLLIAALAAATLVVSLSACRGGGLDSAPANAPGSSSSPSTGPLSSTPADGLASAPASGAATPPSAALAQVSADLSGINAGASQADTDLGAGDSDRAKPDDPN